MITQILHITNDFSGSRVYNQLVQAIDLQGVRQSIFTTIREKGEWGKNTVDFTTKGSAIHYSDNWTPWHRVSFRHKAKSNYKHLLQVINPLKIKHVHAHTLFSDGVLALKLKKDYGIPYTVTIRNTDINIFMRFMWHTWGIGRSVIENANRVVCIAPAHIERVKQWSACPIVFTNKVINIPNGVNRYWLEHLSCKQNLPQQKDSFNLLYMGNFSSNKNLPRLMQSVLKLKETREGLKLHIIGGEGCDTDRVEAYAKKYPQVFNLYGIVQDKNKIRSIMRQCQIFTMPSLTETFGLVYVEALSQGLPILYTKGEGVDGFFSPSYGEFCNPRSIQDISKKIEKMLIHYEDYSIEEEYLRSHFDWDLIGNKYLQIFDL
ncbi:glycosyltransferase [Porphyromonas endodontalis]|uniref:glycosyltransferase n=1 Tax=Porphyromonas endodontalis TaxID=28124 RepID=UPI0026EBCA2B|nr:glycosyltransferase [Porphyromonas endodontalis]